ncbi:hypothetical protein SAMN05216196_10394 [Lutimaribacter pacificus]|uniref:Uncharacterized protein n=1 Tax=Lutimaribacter pacificus TaxID=391948 RepID=A0A1H0G4Y7_9RHOB|nr:hypothetical protein SAMN05216196_10394 [Lutimaribacter pacificus]SHJ84997.1 hypothetical protein SAMN05444142_10295 [Lutimaribacter pacificus]
MRGRSVFIRATRVIFGWRTFLRIVTFRLPAPAPFSECGIGLDAYPNG